MKKIKGGIAASQGFYAAGTFSGIKKSRKKDLALIYSEVPCSAAGIFTSNKVKAAPVLVDQKQVRSGYAQAIIANAGNANCCTGSLGIKNAWSMISDTAGELGISKKDVLVCSTGVIGKQLPMKVIKEGIEYLADEVLWQKDKKVSANTRDKNAKNAADAILTTDLVRKEIAVELILKGKKVRIGAMTKGSGMIAPVMHATMLAFITTDAKISASLLKKTIFGASDKTFNMTVIDNDMSTNDTVLALANGLSGVNIAPGSKEYKAFAQAIHFICEQMAMMMVADGEGATKTVVLDVVGAKNEADAKKVAKAIITSDLFKCMIFGEDPNFGRILAATGYSGADVKPEKISIDLENIPLVRRGVGLKAKGADRIMKNKSIRFRVNLGLGKGSARAYGCDMSFDYVRINSKYRT